MVLDGDYLQPSLQQEFVNVGGSGFQALAVWLIDRFETASSLLAKQWMKMELMRILLRYYFDYFPAQKNYAHSMKELILNVPRLELLASFSYTFACIALHEICHDPVRYRAVFFRQQVTTIEHLLIQPDRYCLAALAKALNWPMEIYDTEAQKSIPVFFQYHYQLPDINWPLTILQVYRDIYFRPLLPTKAWHIGQKNGILNDLVLRLLTTFSYHALAKNKEMLEQIIMNTDKALLSSFDYHYTRLSSWLSAGELTLNNLKTMYIGHLRQAVTHKRVGIEYGHQAYFDQIFQKYRDITEFMLPNIHYTQDLTQSLLYALARGLSFDEMNTSMITRLK